QGEEQSRYGLEPGPSQGPQRSFGPRSGPVWVHAAGDEGEGRPGRRHWRRCRPPSEGRSEQGPRQGDAAPGQTEAQAFASLLQAALEGAQRQAQQSGGLVARPPLQVTEDQRRLQALRQGLSFLNQERADLAQGRVGAYLGPLPAGGPGFVSTPAERV